MLVNDEVTIGFNNSVTFYVISTKFTNAGVIKKPTNVIYIENK